MKIFQEENHRIIHGDALEALARLEDESADLVFADPPYNIGKDFHGRMDHWKFSFRERTGASEKHP